MDEIVREKIANSYEVPNNVFNAVPEPMVSIRMMVYNHINLFKDSIKSILMQKVNFPWEIIIGEDFSTDGTRELVFDYAKRYPDLIRVITADYNIGLKTNQIRCLRACRGKYIAIMDGDDYWTDPLKLQKQYECMEKNKDLSFCWHSYRIKKDGIISDKLLPKNPRDYTGDELICTPSGIVHATILAKNIFLSRDNEYLNDFTDHYKLIAILGTFGNSKFIPDIGPTIYVHHSGGDWTARGNLSKRYAFLKLRLDITNYFLRIKDYRRLELVIKPLKNTIDKMLDTPPTRTLYVELNSKRFLFSYKGIKLEFVYEPIIRKIRRIFRKN